MKTSTIGILIALMFILVLSCTEDTPAWTDPNPTGGPAPIITSIEPDSGFARDSVVIRGENFSDDIGDLQLLFGKVAAKILSATSTEIVAQLPMVNDQTVLPKVSVHGSEFWGYWEGQSMDTSGVMVDDTLGFTFYRAIDAIIDTVRWPAGITTGPDGTLYFIINQAQDAYSKGLYQYGMDSLVSLVRTSTVLGNLIYDETTDTLWGSNLRRGRELGWISATITDGSKSFSKMIKNVVTPSSIQIEKYSRDMFYSSLGYYEMDITPVEDTFDTTITDIMGGIYREPLAGRSFSDTTLGLKVAEYSRPTSCKIHDGYLYVTQAYQDEGAAISRNQILGETLGETEVVYNDRQNVYCVEFDTEGNMYFVPEDSKVLIQLNPDTGAEVPFFPDDIVPTAHFMTWSGTYLILVYSNVADDMEVTAATEAGQIQRVYTGSTGYQQ